MKIIFFIIIVFTSSCNSNSNKQSKISESITSEDSLKKKLIGKWGGLGEDKPVFYIKQDSIYYYNRATAYPYKIVNKNLLIDLPEITGRFNNISVVADTLFFYDDQGILTKGYRFK